MNGHYVNFICSFGIFFLNPFCCSFPKDNFVVFSMVCRAILPRITPVHADLRLLRPHGGDAGEKVAWDGGTRCMSPLDWKLAVGKAKFVEDQGEQQVLIVGAKKIKNEFECERTMVL